LGPKDKVSAQQGDVFEADAVYVAGFHAAVLPQQILQLDPDLPGSPQRVAVRLNEHGDGFVQGKHTFDAAGVAGFRERGVHVFRIHDRIRLGGWFHAGRLLQWHVVVCSVSDFDQPGKYAEYDDFVSKS